MWVGYSRPLEATDLWKLSESRFASTIGSKIVKSFARRHKEAEEYNERLSNGDIRPTWPRRLMWTLRGNSKEREIEWRSKGGRRKASLTFAMNDAVFSWFWVGGFLKLFADTAQMTCPLLVKEIIKFAQKSYTAHAQGLPAPPLGKGMGLAVALLVQQVLGCIAFHHCFYQTATSGVVTKTTCSDVLSLMLYFSSLGVV